MSAPPVVAVPVSGATVHQISVPAGALPFSTSARGVTGSQSKAGAVSPAFGSGRLGMAVASKYAPASQTLRHLNHHNNALQELDSFADKLVHESTRTSLGGLLVCRARASRGQVCLSHPRARV
jgi:hypothetical protein